MTTTDRTDYDGDGLQEDNVDATPWGQVTRWVDDAVRRHQESGDVPEPTAMSLATVDAAGIPNVRTVLMRLLDERGPGFVTSLESAKATELAANPRAAASLTWPSMFRAIRFRGTVVPIEREPIEAYFVSRPWESRISAWASRQSAPVEGRAELDAAFQRYATRWPDHGNVDDVPVPDRWGGFRLVPDEVEFWAGRRGRLHDRIVFTRVRTGTLAEAAAWQRTRRQP
jgi:pyridoxamine 5'-phosphate oxidase